MHLGHADRQGGRETAPQPAQGLVPQPRRGGDRGRLRGHLCAEAVATGVSVSAVGRAGRPPPPPKTRPRPAPPTPRRRHKQGPRPPTPQQKQKHPPLTPPPQQQP